jgi:2-iminobutanoate/2-iminopropanoate deaminase
MIVRFAATLCAAAALASAPAAAQITRYAGDGPSIILQGVEVQPGAKMLYLSGMLADPVDPAKAGKTDLTMADYGDTKTQTISTLNKIKKVLESRGYALSDAIKMTVYVAGDPALGGKMDFAGMNAGFRTFFGTKDNPNTVSRSTIQVAALAGPAFLVEIEVTAAKAK